MTTTAAVAATTPEPCAPQAVVLHGRACLGLDEPLPLLGGGARLLPGGLASLTGADHLPGFRSIVASACRDQAERGRNWYRHPPTALLAPVGTGRGLAAHWLARVSGLPLFSMPADRLVRSTDLHGRTPGSRLPPPPVLAIAAARCANPIILVEVPAEEDLEPAAAACLASIVDPARNARWLDPEFEAVFDLSHVNWIIQADTLPESVADALEGNGHVLQIHELDRTGRSLRNLGIAVEACAAAKTPTQAGIFEALEACDVPPSGLRRHPGCAELSAIAEMLIARAGGTA